MNNFMQTDENLCAALKKRVVQYKDAHPSMSSQQIAKRFDMPASSLNRIENGDIKKPSIDQVIKVLVGIGRTDELMLFLEESHPQIGKVYSEHYSHINPNKQVKLSSEKYFQSESSYQIMLLAFSDKGTSREEVQSKLGTSGLNTLDELINVGALFSQDGKIFGDTEKVKMTQETTAKLLSNCILNSYDSQGFYNGKKANTLRFKSNSLNGNKVMPLIRNVLERANSELSDIFDNDENIGNDCIWAGLVSDSLFLEINENKGLIQ